MAEKFYSVALCVLAAVLIRWCVSISSYSGNFVRKIDRISPARAIFSYQLDAVDTRVDKLFQILLDRMVVIFLQEKENHRCLEITKHRGTGWK